MTDDYTRDLARRTLIGKSITDLVSEANSDLRGLWGSIDLQPGDRIKVGDLGTVQMTDPKPAYKVVDPAAFQAWVAEHFPEHIITTVTVRPAFIAALAKTGEIVTSDGEVLTPDGIGMVTGVPHLMVSPTEQSRVEARRLLGGLPTALEAGEGE